MLSRLWRSATAAAIFAYFGLGGVVLSWVALPLALRGLPPKEGRRRARTMVSRGFRSFHRGIRAFGLVDYDPALADLGDLSTPCVVVANHPTLFDTPALGAALPDACFIAREDYYRSKLFGPLLRACGHLEAGRNAAPGDDSLIDLAVARLSEGASLVVFPEGTRSPPNGLRRLRRGAFEIACRARVPVVVLLIVCDPPMLYRGASWYDMPPRAARYTVTRIATVHPDEVAGDARALARRVDELYRASIKAWNESREPHARA